MRVIYKISDLIGKLGNTLKFIGVLSDTLDFFNKRFEEEFPKDKRPVEIPEETEITAENEEKAGKTKK